ncbi:MAG TPA: PEP-CTERM sorting domain-containing protein [Phycisphaerae bacterium]|nr:PEP-CTERM sorting domain-containing protein [Phycisphaerae bacterium]
MQRAVSAKFTTLYKLEKILFRKGNSMQINRFIAGAVACSAAFFLPGMLSSAHAALIYDLEATTLNGSALGGSNTAKSIQVQAGDVIGFNIFATMSTGTSSNDGFQSGVANLLSTGPILGNLTQTNNATFATGAFSSGTQHDIDGDGDTDVGGLTNPPSNTDATAIQYLAASSVAGNNILIGSGTFTVTSLGAGGSTTINLSLGTSTALNKNPLWTENGSTFNASNGTIGAPNGFVVTSGAPTPEPASLGILAIGGLGLLARRRKAC